MEFEQIGEIIGLANSAVGMTGKAASTVKAVKELISSGKTPDNSEAAQLLNTLATELTAANMTNVQLSEALRTLSQELQRQDEFGQEKARYELFKTEQNDFVYRLKEEASNGQDIHYICPVCFQRDKLISFISGELDHKYCQTDRSHRFRFQNLPSPGVFYV